MRSSSRRLNDAFPGPETAPRVLWTEGLFFCDLTAARCGAHARGVGGASKISRGSWQASAAFVISLTSVVWPTVSLAQDSAPYLGDPSVVEPLPLSPLYAILLRACPDARIEATELDAVRVVEGKLAVAAAMRAAARRAADDHAEYGKPGADGRYRFANTPREVATAIRQSLGPSSLLARSADTVAFVTDAVEYTAQIPLDRVNDVADVLVEQARRAGLRNMPVFRLRSRIENDRAGVTLSARW